MAKKSHKLQRSDSLFYFDALITLLPFAVLSCYRYGYGAILRIVSCMAVSVLCELIGSRIMKCPRDLSDCSALFIGAATALMLPANINFLIPFAGVAFSVIAVKLPLGGTFSSPFTATAAGFSFMTLCWADRIFSYPIIGGDPDSVNGLSLAKMLSQNTSIRPNYANIIDVLTGNYSGTMGASCVIVLLACSVYLCIRQRKIFFNISGYFATCAFMALLFPRISLQSFTRLTSLLMELCSGVTAFAGIYFVTDPATSPTKRVHRFWYGVFTGVICMVMRYFSGFEESTCFGILIANASWPAIQMRIAKIKKKNKTKSKTADIPSAEKVKEVSENG